MTTETSQEPQDQLPDWVAKVRAIGIDTNAVGKGGYNVEQLRGLARQAEQNFASKWRAASSLAEARFPNAQRWHFIASAPITASIKAGRALVRDIHPSVTLYDHTTVVYEAVLDINP